MISARLMNVVDYVALTYAGGIGAFLAKTFELEDAIRKAGMNIYPPLYAARLFLVTAAAALISLYLSAFLWLSQMSIAAKLLLTLTLFLLPVIVFAIGLYYPSYREGERRSWVDTELPLFAAYLTAMAMAGLDVTSTLERLAKLRTFKGIKAEADKILSDVKVMGRDPLDAIERNVSYHPSKQFRDFLQGYVAVTKTGGSVVGYLETKTADMFRQKIDELKLIADRVALYMELYIILGVIVSISLYLLFTVNALMPGSSGGFSSVQLLIYSFFFMPLTSLALIYLIGRARPRNPIDDLAPLAFLITYGIPLFFASLIVLGSLTGGYRVLFGEVTKESVLGAVVTSTISLVLLSFPSVIAWRLRQISTRGVGNSIANFLRDLVEVRKMGLSPEKSIILLSQRDYGSLNPVLRKMATSLTLGFDIEKAITTALRGYRNWTLIATMRFLSDVIVFGGGSIETLDSLARFSRSLADFEEELSKKFKVYLLMPYVGVALVVGSSLLMISYMVQTLALDPVRAELFMDDIRLTALYISLGAVFNAWLMGLVAGKITSGSALGGLLHSVILTLMAGLVAFYIISSISF
ncbi:MAG: type II secretion system F family protein [Acidilobaceae archaeon]|nr:type II secretion system F family protein [Acidilobaceae archaeon]MCX8165374.1 type II secretion system F family protein [Acidilobaceae archaeon]MDW7973801.1 type II secretion system F family protein [Sulfolobales archaeon]